MSGHGLVSSRGCRGFTLVELLVVIAIITLLMAIMLPSLRTARDASRRTWCHSQVRQLILAQHQYAGDHSYYLPGENGIAPRPTDTAVWSKVPTEQGWLYQAGAVRNPELWLCPSDLRPRHSYTYSYTLNGRTGIRPEDDMDRTPRPNSDVLPDGNRDVFFIAPRRIDTFMEPGRTIALAEENTGHLRTYIINDPRFTNNDMTEPRHLNTSVAGYLDGHTDNIPPAARLFRDPNYWPIRPKGYEDVYTGEEGTEDGF